MSSDGKGRDISKNSIEGRIRHQIERKVDPVIAGMAIHSSENLEYLTKELENMGAKKVPLPKGKVRELFDVLDDTLRTSFLLRPVGQMNDAYTKAITSMLNVEPLSHQETS